MKKNIYHLVQVLKARFREFCLRKTAFYFVLFFGLSTSLSAQLHEHDDSVRMLGKNDFTVAIVSSNNQQLQFQAISNIGDSITPLFVELSAGGFQFSDECILFQSINNLNLYNNIEKIWGPDFVSVGVGVLPPGGRYVSNLAILNGLATGAYIRVRIYGSINGQDILWTGIAKR